MSFFKRLFQGASFAECRDEADALFTRHDFATARQHYQKALDRAKDTAETEQEHCRVRIGDCLDGMARARIAEAKRLIASGDLDLAADELSNAMETAASNEVATEAESLLHSMEKQELERQAEVSDDISDEDRWALLCGNWAPEQLDEYDTHGEALRHALLAMHAGDTEVGHQALETIVAGAENPVFLWLEVGRSRAVQGEQDGAVEAFEAFLNNLDESFHGDARLAAHVALAQLFEENDDEEAAIGEFETALESMPGDPRPFFALGSYLRQKDHAAEAVEVLETALELLDSDTPDWRILEELGMAKAAAEDIEGARQCLEQVVEIHVNLRRLDFPPATAVTLATLYESQGKILKAADLYRGLADGSDRANHVAYLRKAAALLGEIQVFDEARRMLMRALRLAETNPEEKAAIESELQTLGAS